MKNDTDINVVELFAGVGGFRQGLENSSFRYKTIWANQWEPGKKVQHAFDCYVSHFGSANHVNEDIALAKLKVPTHDLLVGGFPCQDYSVAQTGARGIEGKKGVLWWDIKDIIHERKPKYILLENVDRLIKSPTTQRGRDFGIILRCLNDDGYAVEWRVINAAEYGQAQRRRRIFIFAYKNTTPLYKRLSKRIVKKQTKILEDWILNDGFYAPSFPVYQDFDCKKITHISINKSLYDNLEIVSQHFKAPFYNSGVMVDGNICSIETSPITEEPIPLRETQNKGLIDQRFFLNGSLEKWKKLKGAKRIPRTRPNGEPYVFSEGEMCFPDNLDKPARTMLTSESSVNRSSHVIKDSMTGELRLLTPEECEKLNGFPEGWTNTGMPEKFRYFTMGNALVVPIITRIGNRLLQIV